MNRREFVTTVACSLVATPAWAQGLPQVLVSASWKANWYAHKRFDAHNGYMTGGATIADIREAERQWAVFGRPILERYQARRRPIMLIDQTMADGQRFQDYIGWYERQSANWRAAGMDPMTADFFAAEMGA